MKKTLALVLALAMVFSTITVAFAEDTLGADAQICADLGMLKGETGTVDAAYVATAPTRLQAAVMFLRLKGLEAEALAFTGEENFADGNIAWAEGANLLAYLKANPQLGWVGDAGNFKSSDLMTAKAYYKVLLETLGYKQTSAEVVGDFTWDNVLEFAATVGLSKVADVANFTVNDLAVATVEALKINVKDTDTTLVASLVEAGKITAAAAKAAGLVEEEAPAVAVAVDEATAAGNAAVDVVFEDDVDAAAAGNIANYSIEGLEINAVSVLGSDAVRLDTAPMTSGKIYSLTVGEKTVKFTAVSKVSGGPEIDGVLSEDVEEVVITFTKNIDFATGTDVANYSIAGVTIVAAEIDPDAPDEVILTTEGLKNKTKYTVKVTNVKSIDGTTKKSDSDTFTVKYDLVAPKLKDIDGKDVQVQTNQRIKVLFTEKVSQASAEDLANYSIKVDETDGAELEIISITWDDDDKNFVEIVTEPMEKREDYKLSVVNIADRRKVANVMTRPATAEFKGIAEDETRPTMKAPIVLSPTTILVEFNDDSKIDEESALDLNNYDLEDLDIESIKTIKNKWRVFKALLTVEEMETGENYKLTVSDVLDEFGNALKETTPTVKGNANSFAAVKVTGAKAIDENTIEVYFENQVDEDEAENISNYSIDQGIGAPTDAEYKEDDNKVILTVNDLVNGYELALNDDVENTWQEYELTVDGVQDLAGNELYYEVTVDTTKKWESDRPELEDATSLDKDVVALSFDEAVKFMDGTRVLLASDIKYVDGDVDIDNTTFTTLTAKHYTDDFEVVEFSVNDGFDDPLTADKTYTVVGVVYGDGLEDGGIRDLIGNLLDDITFGDIEFVASDEDRDGVEVDSYEQTNAVTFEVTMTDWVEFAEDANGDPYDEDTVMGGAFTASIDEDVITFTKKSGTIKEDDEIKISLSTYFVDKHNVAVVDDDTDNDITVFDGEFTDEDKPYIEEVEAIDRETIKITFSEDIQIVSESPTGIFLKGITLNNYDLGKEITVSLIKDKCDNDGDNVLKLHVSKALEARYEYELTFEKEIYKDFANKENDEESFYFDGTNLQK